MTANEYISKYYSKIELTANRVFRKTSINPHEAVSLFVLHILDPKRQNKVDSMLSRLNKEGNPIEMFRYQSTYFTNQRNYYNSELNIERTSKEVLIDHYDEWRMETVPHKSEQEPPLDEKKLKALEKALNEKENLSYTDKRIFVYHYQVGKTPRKIAEILDCETHTVIKRIKKINEYLQHKIEGKEIQLGLWKY